MIRDCKISAGAFERPLQVGERRPRGPQVGLFLPLPHPDMCPHGNRCPPIDFVGPPGYPLSARAAAMALPVSLDAANPPTSGIVCRSFSFAPRHWGGRFRVPAEWQCFPPGTRRLCPESHRIRPGIAPPISPLPRLRDERHLPRSAGDSPLNFSDAGTHAQICRRHR
jgi:hypothetical protein